MQLCFDFYLIFNIQEVRFYLECAIKNRSGDVFFIKFKYNIWSCQMKKVVISLTILNNLLLHSTGSLPKCTVWITLKFLYYRCHVFEKLIKKTRIFILIYKNKCNQPLISLCPLSFVQMSSCFPRNLIKIKTTIKSTHADPGPHYMCPPIDRHFWNMCLSVHL